MSIYKRYGKEEINKIFPLGVSNRAAAIIFAKEGFMGKRLTESELREIKENCPVEQYNENKT